MARGKRRLPIKTVEALVLVVPCEDVPLGKVLAVPNRRYGSVQGTRVLAEASQDCGITCAPWSLRRRHWEQVSRKLKNLAEFIDGVVAGMPKSR